MRHKLAPGGFGCNGAGHAGDQEDNAGTETAPPTPHALRTELGNDIISK